MGGPNNEYLEAALRHAVRVKLEEVLVKIKAMPVTTDMSVANLKVQVVAIFKAEMSAGHD